MSHPNQGKPDSTELAKRLRTVTDYVRDCERRVALGEIMELEGLDRNVMEICDGIAKLPKDQSTLLEKQLATLIGDLENLADTMREQDEKLNPDGDEDDDEDELDEDEEDDEEDGDEKGNR